MSRSKSKGICDDTYNLQEVSTNALLSGDGLTGVEGGIYLRIQENFKILLLLDLLMTGFDALCNPLCKIIPNDLVTDIDDELLW